MDYCLEDWKAPVSVSIIKGIVQAKMRILPLSAHMFKNLYDIISGLYCSFFGITEASERHHKDIILLKKAKFLQVLNDESQ